MIADINGTKEGGQVLHPSGSFALPNSINYNSRRWISPTPAPSHANNTYMVPQLREDLHKESAQTSSCRLKG